ncbi:biotin-dependent carboxyltransferase family protein [Brucella anthropi]|uniref:Biotin-dependent carboxyltransferase n=1 Tax=Brucella anthropi TaxID=529 RepID=A0A6L3Z283_BRUAN|nr:biotin-dependent carboxyltransferase family protein [Brucella anthropi]KAB2764285.1 biotin-dependent carboxyltransferase [Brucella anthropi]HBQ35125.1 aminopeptidase [Brucella anthropi]
MSVQGITVLKPGLETTVQELPGRIGYLEQGFPISGPFDKWSFRQANLLAGNPRDTAALECQFLGPALRFDQDAVVAVTGADMRPKLDGEAVPMWQTLPVLAGQMLELGAAYTGARGYIAISGGIDTPVVLGSRAVFHMARVGGQALAKDQCLPLGPQPSGTPEILTIPEANRPCFSTDKTWQIEALAGPNDDWLDPATVEMFFSADWSVQAKSNRTGIRLTGPEFSFAGRALNKSSDHGQDPSNIIDHGYPLGAVNLAGQTPIILVNDAPSTGGFINPFTVASAAFWKLAQTKPGDILRFRRVDREEAGQLRAALETMTCAGVTVRV